MHNESYKIGIEIPGTYHCIQPQRNVGSLSGSKLGIWVTHGEGKFSLPYDQDKYTR